MRSRLQKEVLALYRQCLRAAHGKPGIEANVRIQFRRNAVIPRQETMRIEYLLRQGYRKLQMIQNPHISGMGHFVDEKK